MIRFPNEAAPLVAALLEVPLAKLPVELSSVLFKVRLIVAEDEVTLLLTWSWTVTSKPPPAKLRTAPAVVPVGWIVKARWCGWPMLIVNEALVPVSGPAAEAPTV